jgi:CHAD domain-containing protein
MVVRERRRAVSIAASDRARFAPPTIDPATPARDASQLLLAALAATVREHVEQIVGGEEAEAIHDLRVDLRRARCLLGPLRGVFSRSETEGLREGVRWLGDLTGPMRDRELLAERLEKTRAELLGDDRWAIDSLLAFIGRDRDQARRDVLEGLGSVRCQQVMKAWARLAAAAPEPPSLRRRAAKEAPARPDQPAGEQPVGKVAAAAIDRAWRRLVHHGRALSKESALDEFHEVRIDGKKLRYLLELFRSAYSSVDLGPTIRTLKALQDCLGDLNDARVQEEALRLLAPRVAAEGGPATGTLLVIGRLIERSEVARARARRRYERRFAALDSKENRRLLRSL